MTGLSTLNYDSAYFLLEEVSFAELLGLELVELEADLSFHCSTLQYSSLATVSKTIGEAVLRSTLLFR